MKGDRVPLEIQKKKRADKQRERIAKKKELGIPWFKPKHVSEEQKAINKKIKSEKRLAWMETDEGREHFEKLWSSRKKHASAADRNKFWSREFRAKAHTDLDTCLIDRLRGCRYRAKKKGLEFNLTLDYLRSIYTPICPYLEIELGLCGEGRGQPNSLSIDRIDPTQGYVIGNIRIISNKANAMKNNVESESLLLFAKNIIRLHSGQVGDEQLYGAEGDYGRRGKEQDRGIGSEAVRGIEGSHGGRPDCPQGGKGCLRQGLHVVR